MQGVIAFIIGLIVGANIGLIVLALITSGKDKEKGGESMTRCNLYCNGFGKFCGYRTQDGFCVLSQNIVYTNHTEEIKTEDKDNSAK